MAEGELWYIDRTNKPTDNTQLRTTDESEVQPRSGSAPVATAKPTKKAHSEVLARLRQPTDYMSMTARARFSEDRGPGLDVDELIANEIRGLEREMKIQTRVSVDTFDPRGSAQYSDFEPVYRYNPGGGGFGVSRGPAGGGGGGGQSARDAMRMSGGSDYLRSSVETLGSTGFRGLLDPALRLDSVWEVTYKACGGPHSLTHVETAFTHCPTLFSPLFCCHWSGVPTQEARGRGKKTRGSRQGPSPHLRQGRQPRAVHQQRRQQQQW